MTDYRIMSRGNFLIGLNEVAVGLRMPIGIGRVFQSLLGERIAEKMTLIGELVNPEKAKSVGLIDEIVSRYRTTYFQHIFTHSYSAGYYSYIWAAVLDSDAFAAFKDSGDVFNEDLANKYREFILEKGGTEDPMKLYRSFKGDDPDISALLEDRGLN